MQVVDKLERQWLTARKMAEKQKNCGNFAVAEAYYRQALELYRMYATVAKLAAN